MQQEAIFIVMVLTNTTNQYQTQIGQLIHLLNEEKPLRYSYYNNYHKWLFNSKEENLMDQYHYLLFCTYKKLISLYSSSGDDMRNVRKINLVATVNCDFCWYQYCYSCAINISCNDYDVVTCMNCIKKWLRWKYVWWIKFKIESIRKV
jgi:hypothetical protein